MPSVETSFVANIYGNGKVEMNTDATYVKEGTTSWKWTLGDGSYGALKFIYGSSTEFPHIDKIFADSTVDSFSFSVYNANRMNVEYKIGHNCNGTYGGVARVTGTLVKGEWTTVTITRADYENIVSDMASDGADNRSNSEFVFTINNKLNGWTFYFDTGDGGDTEALAKLQEYKDAGLTIYMPQVSAIYLNNEHWETSNAKRVLDLAEKVGLKVILLDNWIFSLTTRTTSLLGDTYATIDDLASAVKERMAVYAEHPAFYGVMLDDEPSVTQATAFGEMYRAIKMAYPETYVQFNLLGMTKNLGSNYVVGLANPGSGTNLTEAQRESYYRQYLTTFLDAMGADHLQYAFYPMFEGFIYETPLAGLQIAAELCKSRGIDLEIVIQTFSLDSGGNTYRAVNEKDLYWLNNIIFSYGVKHIYYFTYWGKVEDNDNGNYSFVNRDGEKTAVYYSMQKIMNEMKKLAPVIMQYDYNASAMHIGTLSSSENCDHFYGLDNATFNKLSVSVDYGPALVTELKNQENGYMYAITNVADPDCTCSGAVTNQKVTLTFNSSVSKITVYTNGVSKVVNLTGTTYSVNLSAGQAVYIVVG